MKFTVGFTTAFHYHIEIEAESIEAAMTIAEKRVLAVQYDTAAFTASRLIFESIESIGDGGNGNVSHQRTDD